METCTVGSTVPVGAASSFDWKGGVATGVVLVARPVLGLIARRLAMEWLVAARPVGGVLTSPSAASPSLHCNLQGTGLP